MPTAYENRYLGRRLNNYQTFKKAKRNGLFQIRDYAPKIKIDPFRIRTYNKIQEYGTVKHENKPVESYGHQTIDYTEKPVKDFDHYYEYNQEQDEKEEKQRMLRRVQQKLKSVSKFKQLTAKKNEVKEEVKEEENEPEFFPDGLWKGTIKTVQRNFLLMYNDLPRTRSETSSPSLTPTAVVPEVEEPEVLITPEGSPRNKSKKVVIQEKPTEVYEITENGIKKEFDRSMASLNIPQDSPPRSSSTLIPSYIEINYSSAHWNDF